MSHPSSSTRRKARKIRYHEHEWGKVVTHARACGLPPATFVRKVSMTAKPRARRNRTGNELIVQLGRIATELERVLHPGEHAGVLPQEAQLRQVLEEALAAIRRVG